MKYDRLKEEILPRWEEILSQIAPPAKKAGEYVCPFCGHGKGKSKGGDGIRLNPQSTKYGLKCFGSCGFSGDILALLGKHYGLDSFTDQITKAGYLLGIDIEERELSSKVAQKKPRSERNTTTHMNTHTDTYTQKPEPQKKDYTNYFKECTKRLSQTNYLSSRGISTETASRYWIGYDPEGTPYGEKSSTRWKALIIPTGKYSYILRNTDTASEDRFGAVGSKLLFNTKALREASSPIFITEGELDALSIIEVGGEAVGLGSANNKDKLINLVEKTKPSQPLVLALDNDEAGRKASEELSSKLETLKVPFYTFNVYGDHKDANEALVADREALTREVSGIVDRIGAEAREALEAEREEYLKNTAQAHIIDFIDGITDSVNTPAIPTGYDILDASLDGGLYAGLYIIGAITSLGKTTLTLQLADQIAREDESKAGRDVIIFSLEMARAELMSKSISRLTLLEALSRGVDTSNAKTARGITTGSRYDNYSDLETTIIFDSIGKYRDYYSRHIFIHEGIGEIGVKQIRDTVEKHRRLFPDREAPVVIVDYLQILAPYNDRASDKQNTDKAVLELKRISRDSSLPVIAVSSLNRTNYNEEIKLEAMKESGGIEYGSDVVLGLQLAGAGSGGFNVTEAKAKDPREVELVILKNRNGRTGDKIAFKYYPLFNYFEEDLEKNVIQPTKTKRKVY